MDDEFYQWKKQQENKGRFHFKIFESVKPIHVILIGVLFFLATLILKNNQAKWVYLVIGGLVVLFFLSLAKQGAKKDPIPRDIAQAIAKHDIEHEIQAGRVFTFGADVIPTGAFVAEFRDYGIEGWRLMKYHFGFIISEKGKSQKEIRYSMDPYTGLALRWEYCPLGWNGDEVKDIKYVPVQITTLEEKKDVFQTGSGKA